MYDQARTVITGMIVAGILLIFLPIPLFFFFAGSLAYYIMALMCISTLFFIKKTGIYFGSTLCTLTVSYLVISYIIIKSGGVFSVHIATLYMLMMTGFWVNRRIGHCMIVVNIGALVWIYYSTEKQEVFSFHSDLISGKKYALLFHSCLTLFFGVFFSFVQKSYDKAKAQIRKKQLLEINSLNKLVKKRNQQLESMRQNIASDFHDETGNILAAINQQASILKIRLGNDHHLLPVLENITTSCESLYSSSKDFLWSINNDSDNPMVVFYHLIAFGQNFYNQFEISFSAKPLDKNYYHLLKIAPFASRNIILIFKEAMTNAAKHSGATKVTLKTILFNDYLRIVLQDNGTWKAIDPNSLHNGLQNMERRCKKSNFIFKRYTNNEGTCIEIYIPVSHTSPAPIINQ